MLNKLSKIKTNGMVDPKKKQGLMNQKRIMGSSMSSCPNMGRRNAICETSIAERKRMKESGNIK